MSKTDREEAPELPSDELVPSSAKKKLKSTPEVLWGEAVPSSTKELKSSPYDTLVVIGSGVSMQKFKGYAVLMQFGCPYLDDNDVVEPLVAVAPYKYKIEFPDQKPEGWRTFYEYITTKVAKINTLNAAKLLPWFKECKMTEQTKECDSCLARKWTGWTGHDIHTKSDSAQVNGHGSSSYMDEIERISEEAYRIAMGGGDESVKAFWNTERMPNEEEENHRHRLAKRKSSFEEAISVMNLALSFDLKSTKDALAEGFAKLMAWQIETNDLFSVKVITTLLKTTPLEISEELGLTMTEDEQGCKALLQAFKSILIPHVPKLSLTQEILDDKASFPVIMHSYMQVKYWRELRERTQL